jgi:hypothetical protein
MQNRAREWWDRRRPAVNAASTSNDWATALAPLRESTGLWIAQAAARAASGGEQRERSTESLPSQNSTASPPAVARTGDGSSCVR